MWELCAFCFSKKIFKKLVSGQRTPKKKHRHHFYSPSLDIWVFEMEQKPSLSLARDTCLRIPAEAKRNTFKFSIPTANFSPFLSKPRFMPCFTVLFHLRELEVCSFVFPSKTHQNRPTFRPKQTQKSPIPSKDSPLCQKNTFIPSLSSTLLKIIIPKTPTIKHLPIFGSHQFTPIPRKEKDMV